MRDRGVVHHPDRSAVAAQVSLLELVVRDLGAHQPVVERPLEVGVVGMGDLLQRHRQQLARRIAGDLRHRVVDLQQPPALVRPRRRTAPSRSARPRTRGGTPPAPPASHPRRACARCGRARSRRRRRSRAASRASRTPSRTPGRCCRPCGGARSRSPRAGAPRAPATACARPRCTRSAGISISRGCPVTSSAR